MVVFRLKSSIDINTNQEQVNEPQANVGHINIDTLFSDNHLYAVVLVL